jgi:hypothetical protein
MIILCGIKFPYVLEKFNTNPELWKNGTTSELKKQIYLIRLANKNSKIQTLLSKNKEIKSFIEENAEILFSLSTPKLNTTLMMLEIPRLLEMVNIDPQNWLNKSFEGMKTDIERYRHTAYTNINTGEIQAETIHYANAFVSDMEAKPAIKKDVLNNVDVVVETIKKNLIAKAQENAIVYTPQSSAAVTQLQQKPQTPPVVVAPEANNNTREIVISRQYSIRKRDLVKLFFKSIFLGEIPRITFSSTSRVI